MKRISRRDVLKHSMAAGLALGLPRLALGGGRSPNDEVRMAIIGLGGINTVGGVGGRGRQLISALNRVPGAKVVALCDVDPAILENGVQLLKEQNHTVAAHTDLRKVLDDKTIDAVAIATP
ncbi:MAG: Gfo/Idh/MocA family oxidoreductase, partial [Thermoguttaceae bacterium]